MITVYLCDDDTNFLNTISKLLQNIATHNQIPLILKNFNSGTNIILELEENPNIVDIIYLDIMMDGINGIETAKKLREIGYLGKIIFLTSSEEYVYDSFESEPLYYIRKGDIDLSKIEPIFLKACKSISNRNENHFIFEQGKNVYKILLSNIIYFEVARHLIIIHTINNQTYQYYSSLKSLNQKLEKYDFFVQIHRSFIANFLYVSSIQNKDIQFSNGEILTLGIRYEKVAKQKFLEYLSK